MLVIRACFSRTVKEENKRIALFRIVILRNIKPVGKIGSVLGFVGIGHTVLAFIEKSLDQTIAEHSRSIGRNGREHKQHGIKQKHGQNKR